MRRAPRLALLAFPLALFAASCGGGGSSGGPLAKADAAVVGDEHITRAELDRRLKQAKCSYDLQKRDFPKAGSSEYGAIRSQILESLVQRAELVQKASDLNASVTDKQVEEQLKQLKKQYFGGSEKKYKAELKRQCVTDEEVRADIRANLLSDDIYGKVTADAEVTGAESKKYYDDHPDLYVQPKTRVVRHILVKDKATADKLYAQLQGGADFAALAKKYSEDPGSKAQGGQLTISKGQTVPEFDKVAFSLETGEISGPVKTQFGWHIIRAEKPVTKSKKTPYSQVKESIRQQLLQQKRNDLLTEWLDKLKEEFASKTRYAAGFEPATTTTAAPTTTG